MLADLHTHTTASDGSLTPAALLAEAATAGVTLLAITDHDTVSAYEDLPISSASPLTLIRGVEFSTWWQRQGIHIVGLNIDTASDAMRIACRAQTAARECRARAIADTLAKRGFNDAYDGAAQLAAGETLGRPHFARYLVSIGAVKTAELAFKKYLNGASTSGGFDYWAPMAEVIAWIRDAGGTAVLAHPSKYRLTRSRLGALVTAFCAAGGSALEVVSGKQQAAVTQMLSDLARRHALAASTGSDFHQPDVPWSALGQLMPLPSDLVPVWDAW